MTDRPTHPDMRTKKQVTVRMTDGFAKDLNILMAHYGLTNVTYVVQESVAAQADYVRQRWARQAPPEGAVQKED